MISRLLSDENDIHAIKELLSQYPMDSKSTDFDEAILQTTIFQTVKCWIDNGILCAFSFVDNYNNLNYGIHPEFHTQSLEDELVDWGIECLRNKFQNSSTTSSLDMCISEKHVWQKNMLIRRGFQQEDEKTFHYRRDLSHPIPALIPPEGFHICHVEGEQQVAELVALHRFAFGTNHMTIEERLSMMRTEMYDPSLDLLAVAPDGSLAGFCSCGFEDDSYQIGYTDPVGTHPDYRNQGLAKSLVAAGLQELKKRGCKIVDMGTSSKNLAIQKIANDLSYELFQEDSWFCLPVIY